MPKTRRLSDASLVRRSQQGDRRAFGALVGRYDWRLRGLAHALLPGPTAMDAALSVAYLRAWRDVVRVSAREDVGAWLYRITYNAVIDRLRADDRIADEVPGTGIRAGLASLAPADRVAVVLVDRERFTPESAARILGLTPAVLVERLEVARATLARHLPPRPPAPPEAPAVAEAREPAAAAGPAAPEPAAAPEPGLAVAGAPEAAATPEPAAAPEPAVTPGPSVPPEPMPAAAASPPEAVVTPEPAPAPGTPAPPGPAVTPEPAPAGAAPEFGSGAPPEPALAAAESAAEPGPEVTPEPQAEHQAAAEGVGAPAARGPRENGASSGNSADGKGNGANADGSAKGRRGRGRYAGNRQHGSGPL